MKNFAVAATTLAAVEARNLAGMETQPTVPAIAALDGFSPMTTAPPSHEHMAVRADASSSSVILYNSINTCGYLSGNSNSPYYCIDPANYCALATSANGNIGRIACCGATCYFRTACMNYADIFISKACDETCRDDVYMVKCTESAYPYCNTVSFSQGIIDYACGGSDIRTPQLLESSYDGQINPQTYTEYTVTGTSASGTLPSSASASGAPSSGSSTASDNSNASGTPTPTPTPTSNTSNEKKSSTPVGAIVGGVVGGVGALALVGIGILLFLRNKKKDNAAAQQNPPPPMGSMPQPQYAYQDPAKAPYPTSSEGRNSYYPPQQQGSPEPGYPYSQPSMSPLSAPYGQQGFAQQQPYQQAGSPLPGHQQYGAPVPASVAGAAVGAAAGTGAAAAQHGPPSGPVHEVPVDTTGHHRGEMQELE